MVVKIPIKKTPYQKFFVFEAPRKKRKTRVITANPNRRNTDFARTADNFDDIPDDEDDIDLGAEADDLIADDDTDYSIDDMSLDDETPEENQEPQTEDNDETGDDDLDIEQDTEDYSQADNGNDDQGNENDPQEQQNQTQQEDQTSPEVNDETQDNGAEDQNGDNNAGDDGPITDTEDYSDGADGDNTNSDENQENGETQTAPAKSYDEQLRSYNLYNRFVVLYNSVKNYISKLDGLVKDSYDSNLIIRTTTSQLREIEDLLKDYMILQFQNASYVKSLLFYEKAVASIQLVFNLLENINVNDSSNLKQ